MKIELLTHSGQEHIGQEGTMTISQAGQAHIGHEGVMTIKQ